MRLAQFYKYHGINIKTCYADFDKHHIGVVTESQVGTNNYQFVDPALKIWNPLTVSFFLLQFYRSFPGSPDVTAEETVLLAKKYRDHTRPGLCNYYSFHEDIERKQNGKNMDLFSNFTFTALLILLSCKPGWEGVHSLSYNGLLLISLQIFMVSPGTHLQIDRSFFASNGMHVMNYFASFRDFYGSGTQDTEVTKLLPLPKRRSNFRLKAYLRVWVSQVEVDCMYMKG